MSDDKTKKQTFSSSLGAVFPWLRYLGLGVWMAWLFLAFNGTVWLSDIEINGNSISIMFLITSAASAAVLLIAAFFSRALDVLLRSRLGVMSGGVVALFGAVFVIISGPYYTGIPLIFWVGDVMMGAGSALIALKCGQLYGALQPQRALLYALLSQIVLVFIFYFVVGNNSLYQPIPGGPSLAGILALALLPLLAAYLITIAPTSAQQTADNISEREKATAQPASIRKLPLAFWKFVFAILIFTLVTSVAQGYYTTVQSPVSTLSNSSFVMASLTIFTFGFIVLIIRFLKNTALNKLYLLCMVIISVVFAAAPLLKIEGSVFSQSIGFLYSVFDFLVWCLLASVAFDKHNSSTVVFGVGRGIFIIGSLVGWILGMSVLPALAQTNQETLFYIVLAFLVLLSLILVFTEKDFDSLFKQTQGQDLDIEDLFPAYSAESTKTEEERQHQRPWLAACRSLEEKTHLSSREREILERLATGYGNSDIAEDLYISVNTVRTHTQNIYAKLDIHSRQELMSRIKSERVALGEAELRENNE